MMAIMAVLTFAAFTVRVVTGFGSAILLSPIFSNIVPPKEAVVLIILLESFVNLIFVFNEKLNFKLKEVYLGGLSGIGAGIFFFGIASQELIGLTIGAGMAVLAVLMLSGFTFRVRNSKNLFLGLGFVSGIMGVLTGVNGPQIVLALTSQGYRAEFIRSFMITYLLVIDTVTLLAYLFSGYLTAKTLVKFAILAPFVCASYLVGKQILGKLDGENLRKIMLLAVMLSSIILIARYGGGLIG
ncbi:sulfite exporter TauE/SafE family protein [Archaeoglobus neptunius]|uniref:sulfite exporter TauE/SafE family protein n=1 Tax=Archaeoglobus neptunius TaxID=2798580 RepID=UPI001925369B|nr:sulfite exporter TauE/SafE family protein [Archaeoglobus neptunius]